MLIQHPWLPGLLLALLAPMLDAQAPSWIAKDRDGPLYRTQPAVTYDSARGRFVAVGLQQDATGTELETWESADGSRWVRRRSPSSPTPWSGVAISYDPTRRCTVLFGGGSDQPETWEWDGVDWTQRTPGVQPRARFDHSLAYDAVRQRTVLFGGHVAGGQYGSYLNDTWEWDGTQWLQRNPTTRPPARRQAGLVCDVGRQRMVLFGGLAGPTLGDTWEWDGNTWSQRSGPGPAPRTLFGLAYDRGRGEVVLHGGRVSGSSSGSSLADVWALDAAGWRQRLPTSPAGARHAHTLTAGAAGLLTFSGVRWGAFYCSFGEQLLFDAWRWNGSQFDEVGTLQSPPLPNYERAAYDTKRERLVLVTYDLDAGIGCTGMPARAWEFDGHSWTSPRPTRAPRWLPRFGLVYDAARQVTVMVTSSTTQQFPLNVWEWDGNDWTERGAPGGIPTRGLFAVAYDEARRRTVLHGGWNLNGHFDDTWEWDGARWTLRQPSNRPPAQAQHAMAYDRARQRVVLFGGDQTWEWDGNDWTRRSPTTVPPARFDHAMTYDPVRQRVLMVGGNNRADAWEWDGTDWTQTAAFPVSVSDVALAYHGGLGAPLLRRNNQLWAYGTGAAASAAYGAGCGGAQPPRLTSFGAPVLGQVEHRLDLLDAPPSAATAFVLAAQSAQLPLASGCTLLLAPSSVLTTLPGTTNAQGFASAALPVPTRAALAGAVLYSQAVAVDAVAGLALSQGLALTVGQ